MRQRVAFGFGFRQGEKPKGDRHVIGHSAIARRVELSSPDCVMK
jgi:hypothetical protein